MRGLEILTPWEMAQADRLALERGTFAGIDLMERAATAVAREALSRFPDAEGFDILCGPGNNGGDGYAAATLLARAGAEVRLYSAAEPSPGTDAALAASRCRLPKRPLEAFAPAARRIVVDALFGAGLTRALEGDAARAAEACTSDAARVLAVDLPSGLSGATGRPLGSAFRAAVTVTFARPKPGHLLLPGRTLCGMLVVADIGIDDPTIEAVGSSVSVNDPGLWLSAFPRLAIDAHKYSRGHAAIFSGGPAATGAARLAAAASARAGAGAVTVLSPPAALAIHAAHLTAIMVAAPRDAAAVMQLLTGRKVSAAVIGPGFGVGERLREQARFLLDLCRSGAALAGGIVFDADALTSFAAAPESLFSTLRATAAPCAILTPHEGEFRRLFPDLANDAALSKLDRTRAAAARSGAIVLLKGPDTVIAAPNGRAAINATGTPWLATAGSGDVLAGLIGGLLAQGMPCFEAACAGAWIHGEAGAGFGPGLTADDLPDALLPVLRDLHGRIGTAGMGARP